MRSVPIVSVRKRSLTAAIVSACTPARSCARSVSSPRTTSRKWPLRMPSVRDRARVRSCAERPMSTMKTGISGIVTARTAAATGSWKARKTTIAGGASAARTSCGR